MKYTIFRFFLIPLIIFLSCEKKDDNQFQKYLNKKPINFTIENAKLVLSQNDKIMSFIVSKFLKQKSIITFIRRNGSKRIYDGNDNRIDYSIICFNEKIFDVTYNANDLNEERNFWNQDFQLIKDNKNSEYNLENFLYQNGIEINIIKEFIEFMSEFNIFLITKSGENIYVKINFELLEGLIYFVDDAKIYGNVESTTMLEKISDNWYYFKEVY